MSHRPYADQGTRAPADPGAGKAADPGTGPPADPGAGRSADPGSGPPADPEQVARRICLGQLDKAPRTRAQLAETMRRRLVPDDAAEGVLDRLEAVGLVDDAAFASAWVQSRHATRALSGRALARELQTRGVAADDITDAVSQLDDDTELATARDLVRRKLKSLAGVSAEARTRRLVALLGRRGYPAGTAWRVVREVAESDDTPV